MLGFVWFETVLQRFLTHAVLLRFTILFVVALFSGRADEVVFNTNFSAFIDSMMGGSADMNKLFMALLVLCSCGCTNENSASLSKSNAVQVNIGNNKQSINAVGSNGIQMQAGVGNEQAMNLRNSSASQSQTGALNRQTANLNNIQNLSQTQAGVGNTQDFKTVCDKVMAKNIKQSQRGLLNNQTLIIGGAQCDDQNKGEKARTQLPVADTDRSNNK